MVLLYLSFRNLRFLSSHFHSRFLKINDSQKMMDRKYWKKNIIIKLRSRKGQRIPKRVLIRNQLIGFLNLELFYPYKISYFIISIPEISESLLGLQDSKSHAGAVTKRVWKVIRCQVLWISGILIIFPRDDREQVLRAISLRFRNY